MFRESIESHSRDLAAAETLQERLDETEDHGLNYPECELVVEALGMLIDSKEEAIQQLQEAVDELEKASV